MSLLMAGADNSEAGTQYAGISGRQVQSPWRYENSLLMHWRISERRGDISIFRDRYGWSIEICNGKSDDDYLYNSS